MTSAGRSSTVAFVYTFAGRVGGWTRVAALAVLIPTACGLPAFADVTSVDAPEAPIVRVSVRVGNVVIRTWDRPLVQVDGDASLAVERRATYQDGGERSILIPRAQVRRERDELALPAESFVSAALPPGEREVVIVRTTSDEEVGNVTVTIPANSIFVFAHAAKGNLVIHDYRGGTLVAFATRGRLELAGVGGTVFAQSAVGPLVAEDSNFERLRARSVIGNQTFKRCTARQIEVTSVEGSIVYDNGNFGAGLARFESINGNVAIGSTSAAQLGGRTIAGHVYTNFSGETPVDAKAGQADAAVRGGGPVVTASSQRGNVFLYDGSLHARAQLPREWDAPVRVLQHPGRGPARSRRERF